MCDGENRATTTTTIVRLLAGVCQLRPGFVDATDEAVQSGARGEGEGVRLIVVVHCSDADVIVSASPYGWHHFIWDTVKDQKGVFGL